jgi:hypothetical protein
MKRAIDFAAETHTYAVDGIRIRRSVTGVLRTANLFDFAHVPAFALDRARERGTTVHQAIHFFNEHDLDVEQFERDFPDYIGYLRAWMAFCQQRRFVAVLSEHRVYSDRLEVAGTIDCLGLLDGQAVLLDFATGRPDDVCKDLQTAGYLALAQEWAEHDVPLAAFLAAHPVIRRYGVQLRATGTFVLEAYADPRDLSHFRILVEAQRIVAARRPLREVA